MTAYRVAAPGPGPVVVGGLPLSALHFLAPFVLAVIGLTMGGGAVFAALLDNASKLHCSRAGSVLTCVETGAHPRAMTSTAGGSVETLGGPTRTDRECVMIDETWTVCGRDVLRDAPRLKTLGDRQTLEIDTTVELEDEAVVGIVVGLLFGITLIGTAIGLVRPSLARRARVQVEVSPRALTPRDGAPIVRVDGEEVSVERISRGGRGTYPIFALVYGNDVTSSQIGTWMTFDAPGELEPFAEMLRRRLHDVPRA